MQPNRFCIALLLCSAIASHPVSGQALPVCPPLQINQALPSGQHFSAWRDRSGSEAQYAQLTIKLEPGLLRPQLESFLRKHRDVQTMIWQVNEGHYWPTAFQMTSPTLDELLARLLRPYHMGIRFYANHTAEIYYLNQEASQQSDQSRGTRL